MGDPVYRGAEIRVALFMHALRHLCGMGRHGIRVPVNARRFLAVLGLLKQQCEASCWNVATDQLFEAGQGT